MKRNDVRAYIETCLKRGDKLPTIRNQLLRVGHKESVVDRHINAILDQGSGMKLNATTIINGALLAGIFFLVLTLPSLRSGSPVTGSTVVPIAELQNLDSSFCSYPYIPYGDACCLDENNNGVCDVHEDISPKDRANSVYPFSADSVIGSANGFTVAIDGFGYDEMNGIWKLTSVNFTITNEADSLVVPAITIQTKSGDISGLHDVSLGTTLDVGEYIVKKEDVDLELNPDVTQTLEVALYDILLEEPRLLARAQVDFEV